MVIYRIIISYSRTRKRETMKEIIFKLEFLFLHERSSKKDPKVVYESRDSRMADELEGSPKISETCLLPTSWLFIALFYLFSYNASERP